MNTVSTTVQNNLCISCGICKNICPQNSITYSREHGLFLPKIDPDSCIHCGICSKVCPGLGFSYPGEAPLEAATGPVLAACNAWSKDHRTRFVSASGGVISSMIESLLQNECYDVAFCVDTYRYEAQVHTVPVTKQDLSVPISSTTYPKSRYLPISHENAVAFVKANPEKRIIFVGTSCAIRGLLSVIGHLHLNRENYLLIGLFCDKVFNYNVINYFGEDKFCGEKELTTLHFKNKESGGWPGNMKFMFSDGSFCYQDESERMSMKKYFMPERCLYCIDKLNTEADISVGDNFTETASTKDGSNSVIIRTARGHAAWNASDAAIEKVPVAAEAICKAQWIEGRVVNLMYAKLKEAAMQQTSAALHLNSGILSNEAIEDKHRAEYKASLDRLHAGTVYAEDPQTLKTVLKRERRMQKRSKNLILRLCRKVKKTILKIVK